jgi:hypothetical protein
MIQQIQWVDSRKELPLNRRVLAFLVLKNIETTIIASFDEDNGWMSKGEKFTLNQIPLWAELPNPNQKKPIEKCTGCEESTGETKLWCCNHCGLRTEGFFNLS